jgi:hypothetical protein
LRVLVVRSNPVDLSEAVPEAVPIVNDILKLAGSLGGETAVQIDLLSNEETAIGPPTWDFLREQLRRQDRRPYHILVYLGHCSVKKIGTELVGNLQLENLEGDGHDDILPEKFVIPLQNNPIPVVLLVGCMTAAKFPEDKRENINRKIPNWTRGNQSVAQALVNSLTTDVKLVVGMRYRLDSDDAKTFLNSFFTNLLQHEEQRGDIEAAVHFAREELHSKSPYLASYSAPVIFRAIRKQEHLNTVGDEPLFGFLKTTPPPANAPTLSDKPVGNWEPCVVCWDDLQSLPWSTRSQDSKTSLLKALREIEGIFIKEMAERVPFIMPDWLVAEPDKQAFLEVNLHGSLTASSLNGILFPDSTGATFTEVRPSVALTDSGFKLLAEVNSHQVTFSIKSVGGGSMKLPEGPLFEVSMNLGPEVALRYKINVAHIETVPRQPVYPGVNVVLVPPL